MSIDKLEEFAKDGDKNLDNLDVSKGFLQSEKPERQWFNKLFNLLTNKVNEVVDSIDALPFEGGVLADTFLTVENTINQRQVNRGFESVADMLNIPNPKNGLRVYVKSYHAGLNLGGGWFTYDNAKSSENNGGTVIDGWVREIGNYITPEFFGAYGDKVHNDLEAFQNCFDVGGSIVCRGTSEYLIEKTGLASYRDVTLLTINKPIILDSANGRASIFFNHDAPNGSVAPMSASHDTDTAFLEGLEYRNIKFYGSKTIGVANGIKRTIGIGLSGVKNFKVHNCLFSTMERHSLGIGKMGGSTPWYDINNPDSANTEGAVLELMSRSSCDGEITDCEFEYIGSNGIAIFGGRNIKIDGIVGTADLTAQYNNIILIDDASDTTPLEIYAINENIHINRVVTNGRIAISGLASGSITKCTAGEISVVSYDFNQQKNNFGKAPNYNGTSTHLTKPFLWMDYIERGVKVEGNTVNTLELSSAYVVVEGNFLHTTKANDKLVTLVSNGVKWADGTGGSYYDYSDPSTSINIVDNTFTVGHTGATLVGYGTAGATSNAAILDNTIKLINGITTYTYHQTTNVGVKKSSSIIDVGNTVTKDINHHVNVGQSLLTQGVGSNFIKTFANIWSRATGQQDIVAFTASTSNVYLTLTFLDENGNIIRKKITVAPDNTISLVDLDGGTLMQTGYFGVKSLENGTRIFYVVPTNLSLCIDITGVVKYGTGTFLAPPSRRSIDG